MGAIMAQWLHLLDLELVRKVGNVCLNRQPENFQIAEHQDCSVCLARCILHC